MFYKRHFFSYLKSKASPNISTTAGKPKSVAKSPVKAFIPTDILSGESNIFSINILATLKAPLATSFIILEPNFKNTKLNMLSASIIKNKFSTNYSPILITSVNNTETLSKIY